MNRVYRLDQRLLTEQDGLVTKQVIYRSINAAKRANRGNCAPPNSQPKFAAVVEQEVVK